MQKLTDHLPGSERQGKKVPGMVRICGWLLALESIMFFLLGVYHYQLNNGPTLFSRLFARWIRGDTRFSYDELYRFSVDLINSAASEQLLTALIESAVLFVLTTLALWTAIGFFRRWVIAWPMALLVQAGSLLTALVLYFINRPSHIVIMMVTGIFMVLYLNYADVHSFFNLSSTRRPIITPEELPDAHE